MNRPGSHLVDFYKEYGMNGDTVDYEKLQFEKGIAARKIEKVLKEFEERTGTAITEMEIKPYLDPIKIAIGIHTKELNN